MRWTAKRNAGWKNIIDDDKYDIKKKFSQGNDTDVTLFTLKIKNVQAYDYRQYRCEAENRYGSCSSLLDLFGKRRILSFRYYI